MCKINENLCIGCGLCIKRCPMDAIKIINLPKNLDKNTTHRFHGNSFKLHRLPQPRPKQILGLVGKNGIGKSTALQILSGKIKKPNLGHFVDPPKWKDILAYFRGNSLQNYFKQLLEREIKARTKPQYVDTIPKHIKGQVKKVIKAIDKRKVSKKLAKKLGLKGLYDR